MNRLIELLIGIILILIGYFFMVNEVFGLRYIWVTISIIGIFIIIDTIIRVNTDSDNNDDQYGGTQNYYKQYVQHSGHPDYNSYPDDTLHDLCDIINKPGFGWGNSNEIGINVNNTTYPVYIEDNEAFKSICLNKGYISEQRTIH